MDNAKYIVYMLIKDSEGVFNDIPLQSFLNIYDCEIYIQGYMDAIINHTGDGYLQHDDDDVPIKLRSQFSIKDLSGKPVDNQNNKKEAKNG